MTFFLGTHHPDWLSRTEVPLFVSHVRLVHQRRFRRATCDWALDSGAFSELSKHGRWTTRPEEYVASVRRYSEEIGRLRWAAPQDWMCEPHILAKTGLTVAEHQARTIDSIEALRRLAPDLTFIPVLQGWTLSDYVRHVEAYRVRGIDLRAEPLVGLGTVCRRQDTDEVARIVGHLSSAGLRLHGFGVKVSGMSVYGRALASADSMAWSYSARRQAPLPGHSHKNCANCMAYAMAWRERVVAAMAAAPRPLSQF